jgi:cytochrome c-type biogenesis protein CcmH/NrfF
LLRKISVVVFYLLWAFPVALFVFGIVRRFKNNNKGGGADEKGK